MLQTRKLPWIPWGVVLLLTAALATALTAARPFPQDDHYFYQAFIESLARGRMDLSIPGFHGSDFLAVPWYWLTHSSIAQIEFLIFCILLLPLLAFLAGRVLYRDDRMGLLLAAILTMMPFTSFVAFRGWTGPAYFCLMLLAIALAPRAPSLAGVSLALAMLTKPFAVALVPLLFLLAPRQRGWWRFRGVFIALALPAAYVAAQYLAVGRVFVGAHPEIGLQGLWVGWERLFLNGAHLLQVLFSVHNYYFPDPCLTGPGNLLHTTPLLMFLGIFALLSPAAFFMDRSLPHVLLLGLAVGLGLPLFLDHLDHFYLEAGVLILIVASLPVLRKYPLWIPLVLATLHFQWFYFFLQFRGPFQLSPLFFTVPFVVDFLFLSWCFYHVPAVTRLLLQWWDGHPLKPWVVGRTQSTKVQFFRYFFVGGSSAVVDFSLYILLVRFFGVHYLLAQLLTYCFGFTWNYVFSILWVFESSRRFVREVTVVFIITFLGLLWTELLLYFFVGVLGVGAVLAKFIATWIVLFWNFGARKVFVFRK